MKRFFIAIALAAITITPFSTSALAADVGVSLSIGQSGFFSRINIGGYPPPRVLYRRPIAIERVPMNRPPIYLHVPPGHARQWKNHCRDYNACDERVLFVQPNWYKREYVQRYQESQRGNRKTARAITKISSVGSIATTSKAVAFIAKGDMRV